MLTDPDADRPLGAAAVRRRRPRRRRACCAGSRARVSGRLAGRRVGFDVEVHEADGRPARRSPPSGPVGFDVDYDLAAADGGSEVRASVSVRSGGGITGRLLAEATSALLSAGALHAAPLARSRPLAACPA